MYHDWRTIAYLINVNAYRGIRVFVSATPEEDKETSEMFS